MTSVCRGRPLVTSEHDGFSVAMIRAFLFDIGNVLVRFDFSRAVRAVAPGVPFAAALGLVVLANLAAVVQGEYDLQIALVVQHFAAGQRQGNQHEHDREAGDDGPAQHLIDRVVDRRFFRVAATQAVSCPRHARPAGRRRRCRVGWFPRTRGSRSSS